MPLQSPVPSTPRPVGRPKGSKRVQKPARPTFASPDGAELSADPAHSEADAREQSRHPGKSVVSNRLGGGDLQVVRDNIDELSARAQGTVPKRPSSDSVETSGATYALNKRTRARKRIEDMRKELDELEESTALSEADYEPVGISTRRRRQKSRGRGPSPQRG
ncbi:hypothetical protein JG688_00015689 [Phytophthora aleatoria]|uniref:Uncharacterized protein n=1 Tax=Phytophthora aleatoria TaxID=2496075 RepID=A0A8J5IFA9_9STRA|nr:hypothetical protein JG688_00015689 [Phytophthora aleatoria]